MNSTLLNELQQWYETALGKAFAAIIRNELKKLLPGLYGRYIMQIPIINHLDWLEKSAIAAKFYLALDNKTFNDKTQASIIGEIEYLPLAPESLDILLLPHTLNWLDYPARLLKDVRQILIPEGHVIIIGFNPACWLWKAYRFIFPQQTQKTLGPFCTASNGPEKLKHVLNELDYELVHAADFFYRPATQKKSVLKSCFFLEIVGKICRPYAGAGYLLVAKKRDLALTPLRTEWAFEHVLSSTMCMQSSSSYRINKRSKSTYEEC